MQFCFADGSVRMVRYGQTRWDQSGPTSGDWLILQQLPRFRDGGVPDLSELVE